MSRLPATDPRHQKLAEARRGDGLWARSRTRASRALLAELHRFELRLKGLCTGARLLPAVTPVNAASERARLTTRLERGELAVPDWRHHRRRVPSPAFRLLDQLRRESEGLPGRALYRERLDELELDLLLVDAVGDSRRMKPLSARRFGTGARPAAGIDGFDLAAVAHHLLDRPSPPPEPQELQADGPPTSLGSVVRRIGHAVGLDVDVRVEAGLAAAAATGETTVFVADRRFGRREAVRLAVHEVLGHVVAGANARTQPLRLLEWGTAGAFVDQEGVALCLEDRYGLLDVARLRVLAARVVVTDMMHGGARFHEAARWLHREQGFSASQAVVIAERIYRGGGLARDVGYLSGLLRVQDALARGVTSLDELRAGRVGLSSLDELRELAADGLVRPPAYRPNFSSSFLAAKSGTTPLRSPPSDAASLIRLELTKK